MSDALRTLEERFADAIAEIPGEEFSTHDLIRVLALHWPHDYVHALCAYVDTPPNPFQTVHANIGAALADSRNHHLAVKVSDDHPSMDLFGRDSHSVLWRKADG